MAAPKSGVVVLNPGSIPEMTRIANGLARAELLREFVTPIGATSPQISPRLAKLLPLSVRNRLERDLRRRQLPSPLQAHLVRHVATRLEYASVTFGRIGQLRFARLSIDRLRNIALDREVASSLRATDLALITCYAASVQSLRRAKSLGICSYLEYPIAHHGYGDTLLAEETVLCPEFAGTISHPKRPDWLKRQLEQEIDLADKIFVLSSFHRKSFANCGVNEQKLILTPLGVDLNLFQPGRREDDGVFRIAFVGQITQRKGISYLIDAFDRLAIPHSELLMVGPVVGTARPWQGHRGLRHVPAVPRWELPALYATADVYVLPSLLEGFALTALEAMACGLPVIISEHTFGRDVVRDGIEGYVVPIRDTEAIVDRIRYLHDHPAERLRMGAAARQRAEDFSWERYEDRITEVVSRTR